jgi:hypothetical protein
VYATEHDRYYKKIHDYEDLLTEFFYGTSSDAQARSAKAMPLINEDPGRVPDHVFSGPELPLDESVRARLSATHNAGERPSGEQTTYFSIPTGLFATATSRDHSQDPRAVLIGTARHLRLAMFAGLSAPRDNVYWMDAPSHAETVGL